MTDNAFMNATLPEGHSFVDKSNIQPDEIIVLRESVGWKGDSLSRWQKCIEQSPAIVGVRDVDSNLVGMACIAGNVRHAVLCDLAVNSSHQRKGIGAAIMSELLKVATELEIMYLYAELAKTNPFRTKMIESGFEITGDSLFKELPHQNTSSFIHDI